jgi:hypothetical protein
MDRQKTSCVHRGNTFFGTVEVLGDGPEAVVRVHYNGDEREARLDGFPVEVIAHILLRELVILDVEASRAFAFGLEARETQRRYGQRR